jgi:hypothetical protein
LGGVDVDELCNPDENALRKYVKGILNECMPYRYALGPGNYLAMLDESSRWRG